MKTKAGLGVDRLTPIDFERLPDSALEELSGIYEAIEASVSWPWQLLVCLGRLLPKKSSGDRVIGILPMFCRLWSLARDDLSKQWSRDT
eukprot:294860-Pyramimonas_sp.AAC.1